MELFVPGRLCLFGEHSDWAAGYRATHPEIARGYCLVTGTDQGLAARVEPCDRFEIETVLPDGERIGPARFRAEPAVLERAARSAGFFRYAAGAAAVVMRRFQVGGLRICVERDDLPVQKGLSSSAAICVLVARAFDRIYSLGLDARAEMELAYAGERLTGSECGRMDQVCAYGRRVSQLVFDADALEVEPVEPGGTLSLLVVDLRRGKDTRRILRDLNACFPDVPGELAARVRHTLGPFNVEHTRRARAALEAGDAEALGESMREAQAAFDAHVAPACPELRSPRLREVLAAAEATGLACGGKGVGSQGDGCAQLVARDPEARMALARRLETELGVACLLLTVGP